MLNPKQVSDFHADAWFVHSRPLKLVSAPCNLYETPYILAILKLNLVWTARTREFFSRNFCMVAIVRFMNGEWTAIMPSPHRKPQSKIRPGSAGKNSRVRFFRTISRDPVGYLTVT